MHGRPAASSAVVDFAIMLLGRPWCVFMVFSDGKLQTACQVRVGNTGALKPGRKRQRPLLGSGRQRLHPKNPLSGLPGTAKTVFCVVCP